MAVRVFSAAIVGLESFPVEVEVDATPGLHFLNIVGLPDKAVEESKDRIAAAIKNSGFIAPKQKNRRIIVNLAPADIKKAGPAYDLPIALGYLLSTDQLTFATDKRIFLGELSLDGSVRRVSGILPAAFMAKDLGFEEMIVPEKNAAEAAVVREIRVLGISNLRQLCDYLTNKSSSVTLTQSKYEPSTDNSTEEHSLSIDMADIKGQQTAKRSLLVAASGGHNVLMSGPPGAGKTLLAQALAGILPKMNYEESLEVTKIYSICGLIGNQPLLTKRPFRNPHHTASATAIIGGGSWPKPGEITLAHRGVLFLDELPEFPRNVIEALRQPMESGDVVVARAASTVKFPSRFMLVGAMNPCPCGNYGDEVKACVCSPNSVYKYQRKISGPLLDRIDIQINVPRETYEKISSDAVEKETSRDFRETVARVRSTQRQRFNGTSLQTNSEMGPKEIKKFCQLESSAEAVVKKAVITGGISGRGYHKILKIARTIADIENHKIIDANDAAQAIGYRVKTDSEKL